MDKIIKIVMPGICPVKKNNEHVSINYRGKDGRLHRREHPIKYTTKAFNKWSGPAKQACMLVRQRLAAKGIPMPLAGIFNAKMIFYYDYVITVDLSGLYEGPQDILAGGRDPEAWKYQILLDDSVSHIGSHDGSRFKLDPENPRTEIFLEPYNE